MQSVSMAQLFLHVVGLAQMNPLHDWGVAAGQVPMPSQLAAGVRVEPVQLTGLHCDVGYTHMEVVTPSQVPPQPESGLVFLQAWRDPVGAPVTGEHMPGDAARLHAWHWPPHAPSQQFPSTQKFDAHWSFEEQASPRFFLARQVPVLQKSPVMQSVSAPHVKRQLVPLQLY